MRIQVKNMKPVYFICKRINDGIAYGMVAAERNGHASVV